MGKNKIIKENKENSKSSYSINYTNNKYNGKLKKIIDSSNSNINIEEISVNDSNWNLFNNFENNSYRIYNYDNKKENLNSYNNNYIVTIKKRNLAEKLKEEIQKSINKNNINFPSSIITNGKINIENNNKNENIENNSNDDPTMYNGNVPKSNGKKIREKIMQCSKNNIYENNSNIKNQKTLASNYNENIPIRHYELNHSKYVIQYINFNNTNSNINTSIYF